VKLDSFGKATVIVDVKADATTEGAETLNLVLSNGAKVTADVAVNDVSLTPAVVAKTFTLTTGVDAVADFTGTAADDVFNAPATSATSGAAATTVNSGDAINGGAGIDTLNITASATNNNSLTGLTATSIETVNIIGANNLGASSPALAAAEANKVTTAAALTAAQSSLVIAAGRENATTALVAQVAAGITVGTSSTTITSGKAGLSEAIVVGASTATVSTAAQLKAAADYIDTVTIGTLADTAAKAALDAIVSTTTVVTVVPTGVTSFTLAQYKAAAAAALAADTGAALAAGTTTAIDARATVLATAAGALVTYEQANGDFTIGQLNAAATDALSSATASTLLTNLDDGVAISARAGAKATEAGTVLTSATTAATTAASNDATAASAVTVALASVGATSVAASQFADATAITLSGSSSKANVTAVAATQTIGFDGVSSMENSVTFGATVTSGSIASIGSSGALSVTGNAMTTLSLSGTGTGSTGLTITDAGTSATTSLDPIKALNVSTSGSTVLTVSAMTQLTSLTQSGAGAITLTAGTTLASVTTGAGADLINLVTATAIDNPGTTIVETVNASLVSGAGADRLVVATTGAGNTTVDGGADGDTIFVNTLGSGTNSISGGDGNDTIRVNTLNTLGSGATATAGFVTNLQALKIDGGAGTDVLRIANTGFTASDYTILGANVTSVETLQLSATVAAGVTALDASKISMSRIEFLATGTNVVNEVSSSQAVALVRTPVSTAVTGFIAATSIIEPAAITIASKGYIADQDAATTGKQGTVFGDNLNLALINSATGTTVAASADKLTMSVAALGNSGTTAAPVAGVAPLATVGGDLRSLDVTLTSARGSGTNGAGSENIAGLKVSTLDNTAGSLVLENLSSIKVAGSGAVTINAGTTHTALTGKLVSIDLSGMTALLDQNALGQEIGTVGGVASTVGGYNNLSTSSVTLNNNVSETVILGGAKDTVVTGSTIVARDVVTGFQLTASADPLVVDLDRSDVLKFGTAFTVSNAAKMTTTATTLDAAILQAANFTVAGVAKENIVFNFGGNTYAYVDTGADGLTDNDKLVQMSGTLNLDLLLQAGVIIA